MTNEIKKEKILLDEYLVNQLTEGQGFIECENALQESSLSEVGTWIKILQRKANRFGYKADIIIQLILKRGIDNVDENILNELTTFILSVVASYPYYVKSIFETLVRCLGLDFRGAPLEVASNHVGVLNVSEQNFFVWTQTTIKMITDLVPLSANLLLPIIKNGIPFMKAEFFVASRAHMQICYIRNIFNLMRLFSHWRRDLLEIVFSFMVKIDAYCPKEILKAEAEARNEEMFEMEVDDDQSYSVRSLCDELDVLMKVVLDYIQETCYKNSELQSENMKALLKDLLSVFDQVVLPTHACFNVQFLIFYVCTFKPAVSDVFIEYLWKKTINYNAPMVIRQNSVAYIGSLIARAKFVSIKTVKATIEVLSNWINSYISVHNQLSIDIMIHGAFYSSCQALFYMIAFLHKELINMPNALAFLRGLNLQRIITCSLNPLKFCLPAVVNNFSSVVKKYQIAFCDTIIERNLRIRLPVALLTSTGVWQVTNANPLDTFFPFDKCLLRNCGKVFNEHCREYVPVIDSEPEKVIEEDDFLMDDEKFSISPSTSFLEKFMCSTSPGFRQMIK